MRTLLALAVIAVALSSAMAPRAPTLLSEYHYDNPLGPALDCYHEDSIHRRTWWGSGSVSVSLDYCGSGGASLILAAEGRGVILTATAPDGRSWTADGRKTATLCVSGFPTGYAGHSMPAGTWTASLSGERAYLHVDVEMPGMLWPRCPSIVDPTL